MEINYYLAYGFVIVFLTLNLFFTLVENEFSQDIERKVAFLSILSYGQVGLFLFILCYVIVSWLYAIFLSFFEDEIVAEYFRTSIK